MTVPRHQEPTKLLVFAHLPPPHHGQSYMVELMLNGFGGDVRRHDPAGDERRKKYGVHCYHVDARFSTSSQNIGDFEIRKFLLVFWYCLQAIWCRLRHGVKVLYYVPAPGKHTPLYRDWLILLLCRCFFPKLVLHWQAAGLERWLEVECTMFTRTMTYRALGKADASIALSHLNRAGIEKFLPRRAYVIYNAISDPCPAFEKDVLPRRRARLEARRALMQGRSLTPTERTAAEGDPETFHVLFLALCTRDKGVFDAIDAVCEAQEQLNQASIPIRLKLSIGGRFPDNAEFEEFEKLQKQRATSGLVEYLGFVSGEEKRSRLRNSDVLCFPTYYSAENHPVNTVEALAFGLPVVTTRWRSMAEFFPSNYFGIVNPHDVKGLAAALVACISRDDFVSLRNLFCERYSAETHLDALASAIRAADQAPTECPQ